MIAFLLIIFSTVFFSIINGLSLQVFWGWFVSGQGAPFHGSIPDITFVQALGLSLIISFATYQINADSNDTEANATELALVGIGKGVAFYGVFWLIAIIYHGLMS